MKASKSVSVERLIASHLRLAREAYDGAKLLLEGGNRNAVYLAEQAVEQMILAVAQSEGTHFLRSAQHQLDTMVRALPPENNVIKELNAMSWLEAYATTFRYPRTQGAISDPPPAERLTQTLTSIAMLLQRLAKHFDVDLASEEQPARNRVPPR